MKLKLYSIFDRKMNIYLAPFPARNDVDAVRNVQAGFNTPQMRETPIGQNPQDFDLVSIGEFDDDTGEITRSHALTVANVGDLAKIATSTVAS